MFAIIGIVVALGAILAGFLMEKGPLLVLMQPSEFIIIGGAGLGTLIAGNQMHVLKGIVVQPDRRHRRLEVLQAAVSRQHSE